MEILNFPGADQPAPKKKKPARAILGIGIIAAVAALSSTLAANININSGPVEFGQGVAQTVSCGDSEVPIIVTPSSSFTNSDSGTFAMSSITLSDIPDACNGKVFTIKVYDDNSSTPLTLGNLDGTDTSALVWWANGWQPDGSITATRENEAAVYFPGSDWLCFNWESDCYNNIYAVETAYYGNSDVASHSFKLNLPTPIDATRVYKITLETQDDSSALNIWGDNWGFYQEWL